MTQPDDPRQRDIEYQPRIRFVRRMPNNSFITSGYGFWYAHEIVGIMTIHRKFGRDVWIEFEPSEFPAWLGDDIDFFDMFTEIAP